MGTDYIVAGVAQQTQKVLIVAGIGAVVLLLFIHAIVTENTPPVYTDLGDGNVQIVTRVYHRQAGWLLVTNTFYVGKKPKIIYQQPSNH